MLVHGPGQNERNGAVVNFRNGPGERSRASGSRTSVATGSPDHGKNASGNGAAAAISLLRW